MTNARIGAMILIFNFAYLPNYANDVRDFRSF